MDSSAQYLALPKCPSDSEVTEVMTCYAVGAAVLPLLYHVGKARSNGQCLKGHPRNGRGVSPGRVRGGHMVV